MFAAAAIIMNRQIIVMTATDADTPLLTSVYFPDPASTEAIREPITIGNVANTHYFPFHATGTRLRTWSIVSQDHNDSSSGGLTSSSGGPGSLSTASLSSNSSSTSSSSSSSSAGSTPSSSSKSSSTRSSTSSASFSSSNVSSSSPSVCPWFPAWWAPMIQFSSTAHFRESDDSFVLHLCTDTSCSHKQCSRCNKDLGTCFFCARPDFQTRNMRFDAKLRDSCTRCRVLARDGNQARREKKSDTGVVLSADDFNQWWAQLHLNGTVCLKYSKICGYAQDSVRASTAHGMPMDARGTDGLAIVVLDTPRPRKKKNHKKKRPLARPPPFSRQLILIMRRTHLQVSLFAKDTCCTRCGRL